jgi:hypothetical protein
MRSFPASLQLLVAQRESFLTRLDLEEQDAARIAAQRVSFARRTGRDVTTPARKRLNRRAIDAGCSALLACAIISCRPLANR